MGKAVRKTPCLHAAQPSFANVSSDEIIFSEWRGGAQPRCPCHCRAGVHGRAPFVLLPLVSGRQPAPRHPGHLGPACRWRRKRGRQQQQQHCPSGWSWGGALLPLPGLPGCAAGGECAAGSGRGQRAAWTQSERGGKQQGSRGGASPCPLCALLQCMYSHVQSLAALCPEVRLSLLESAFPSPALSSRSSPPPLLGSPASCPSRWMLHLESPPPPSPHPPGAARQHCWAARRVALQGGCCTLSPPLLPPPTLQVRPVNTAGQPGELPFKVDVAP